MGYPFSDQEMIFNREANKYYLTEQALLNYGIDLRARLAERKSVSPDLLILSLIRTVTRHIYSFVHNFSSYNDRQDYLIATVPSLRPIIKEAMLVQAVYVLNVGDLSNSIKPEERAARYHPDLESILSVTLPEIGRSILYTGV